MMLLERKPDSAHKYWTAMTQHLKPVSSSPNNFIPTTNDKGESNRAVLGVWLLFVLDICHRFVMGISATIKAQTGVCLIKRASIKETPQIVVSFAWLEFIS